MSYKFATNAKYFQIDYEVTDIIPGYYPHMGLTAREGICIMYRIPNKTGWINVDAYAKVSPITINMAHFVEENENYEILIYRPLLSKLSKLEIDIPDEYTGRLIEEKSLRNIVVAGGYYSYGIGCTTTSSMFSNILERKFDASVTHLTYYTINYLNNVYDYYENSNPPIADVGIIELDHFNQHETLIEEKLPKIIELMRLRCKYIIGWYSIPDSKGFKRVIAKNIVKKDEKNKNIPILDLSYLHDDNHRDMCVYSPVHINDSGNIMIYKELAEIIRSLTKWTI